MYQKSGGILENVETRKEIILSHNGKRVAVFMYPSIDIFDTLCRVSCCLHLYSALSIFQMVLLRARGGILS